jgi:hypothetical protein
VLRRALENFARLGRVVPRSRHDLFALALVLFEGSAPFEELGLFERLALLEQPDLFGPTSDPDAIIVTDAPNP